MSIVFLLLATITLASADKEPWCRCAAFVTYQNAEIMVYEAPEVTIGSCVDDAKQCKNSCSNELNIASNGGDLWHITDTGVTIGQEICTYLANQYIFFIHSHYVYGYFEVCGGAWEYTGVTSQQALCCNGGKHEHCISKQVLQPEITNGLWP